MIDPYFHHFYHAHLKPFNRATKTQIKDVKSLLKHSKPQIYHVHPQARDLLWMGKAVDNVPPKIRLDLLPCVRLRIHSALSLWPLLEENGNAQGYCFGIY